MWKWVVVVVCVLLLGTAGYCTVYDQVRKDAEALSRSGQRLAAADLLERAIGQDTGQDAEWLRGYVLLLRSAPKPNIIAQFEGVANAFPKSERTPDALLRAGYLRDSLGDDPAPDWERLARDHPNTTEAAEALLRLGHLALRNGDPDTATKTFEEAAAVSGASASCVSESQIEAGYACIGEFWKSRDAKSLTKALKLLAAAKPDDAAAKQKCLLAQGEALLLLGVPMQALVRYSDALKLDTNDSYLNGVAAFELGCCYRNMDMPDRATAAFASFLSKVAGDGLADKDHNWRQARPGFIQTVVTNPEKANSLSGLDLVSRAAYWRAVALIETKRYDDARTAIAAVSAAFPTTDLASELNSKMSATAEGK